jgi:hypothetical protein
MLWSTEDDKALPVVGHVADIAEDNRDEAETGTLG